MQNDNLTALDDSMLDDVSGGASVAAAIGKLVTDMVAGSIGVAEAMADAREERRAGGSNFWDRLNLGSKL